MITAQDVLDFLNIDLGEVNRHFPGGVMTLDTNDADRLPVPFRQLQDAIEEATREGRDSFVEECEATARTDGYYDGWREGRVDGYDEGFITGYDKALDDVKKGTVA